MKLAITASIGIATLAGCASVLPQAVDGTTKIEAERKVKQDAEERRHAEQMAARKKEADEQKRQQELPNSAKFRAEQNRQNDAYVAKLKAKYGNRIHFDSSLGRDTVIGYNIDCRGNDGRYLPLINVIYAQLAAMSSEKAWPENYVEERGGEVRILSLAHYANGKAENRGPVIAEIDKGGQLRPHGSTSEAVLNACDGSYGRIWKYGPKK